MLSKAVMKWYVLVRVKGETFSKSDDLEKFLNNDNITFRIKKMGIII